MFVPLFCSLPDINLIRHLQITRKETGTFFTSLFTLQIIPLRYTADNFVENLSCGTILTLKSPLAEHTFFRRWKPLLTQMIKGFIPLTTSQIELCKVAVNTTDFCWSNLSKCNGENNENVDIPTEQKVKIIQFLTRNSI